MEQLFTFNEVFKVIGICFFFFMYIILILRVTGRRQLSQLAVYDVVIFLVFSELIVLTISEPKTPFWVSVVSTLTLVILDYLLSVISLKFKKIRDIVEGRAEYIYEKGKINYKVMKKERYSIDDLVLSLRDKDISSLSEVDYVIYESSGAVTIIKRKDNIVVYPEPLVSDGRVIDETLNKLNKDIYWLKKELRKKDILDINDVFYCVLEKNGLFVIKK